MRSIAKIAVAAATFGVASLPMPASAGCGCRAAHYSYAAYGHAAGYAEPAVVYHRAQYPTAYYNEPAPPYYPRGAHYRHRHAGPAWHPPLRRHY